MWERNALYKELKALQITPNTSFEYENLPLDSESGWWSVNRLLKIGSSGADVLKLQRALKNNWGLDVNFTSRYDDKTVEAVKKFQKDSKLKEDGIAGPFTQAMIFESNYSWTLPKPQKVKQNLSTCWAAAYESALPLWQGRPKMKVAELLNDFNKFIDSTGIDTNGLEATAKKFKASIRAVRAELFKIETVKKLLLQTKSPILLFHYIIGQGHSVVVFGFGVEEGLPYLLIMDPIYGEYRRLTLDAIQNRGKLITLISPN